MKYKKLPKYHKYSNINFKPTGGNFLIQCMMFIGFGRTYRRCVDK